MITLISQHSLYEHGMQVKLLAIEEVGIWVDQTLTSAMREKMGLTNKEVEHFFYPYAAIHAILVTCENCFEIEA